MPAYGYSQDDLREYRRSGVDPHQTSVIFDTFEAAVAYAEGGAGGWLCRSNDGQHHQWFNARFWTPTTIIDATSHFGDREIGTWPMFCEYLPCCECEKCGLAGRSETTKSDLIVEMAAKLGLPVVDAPLPDLSGSIDDLKGLPHVG